MNISVPDEAAALWTVIAGDMTCGIMYGYKPIETPIKENRIIAAFQNSGATSKRFFRLRKNIRNATTLSKRKLET
jgi:hypothetical protein